MALDQTPQDQDDLRAEDMTENGELLDGDIEMSSEGESRIQAELDQEADEAANREQAGHDKDAQNQQAQADQSQARAQAQAQAQEQQRQFSEAGPAAFSWAAYKGLRIQQKVIAKQERAQGKDHALGYNQINPGDKSAIQGLQRSMFGSCYFDLDEEDRKRKQELLEYYDECRKKGTPVLDTHKSGLQCFEDKLFDGYRLDKSLTGNPILSMRVVDPSGRHQQVFDDGKNVRACTNGDFNATTAMAMATMFWGHRAAGVKATGDKMTVNLNVKKTLKGAMGGKTADEKRSYLIAANLHMAHKHGIEADIIGNNMPDLEGIAQEFDNIRAMKAQNQNFDEEAALADLKSRPDVAMLEKAVKEYRETLANMSENANFDLESLLKNPVTDNAFKKELVDDAEMSGNDAEAAPKPSEPEVEPTSVPTFKTSRDKEAVVDPTAVGDRLAELPQAQFVKAEDGTSEFVSSRGKNANVDASEEQPKVVSGEILSDDEADPFTGKRDKPDSKTAVASEPRTSHGNAAEADPAKVDQTLKAEQQNPKPEAGQVLGLPSRDQSSHTHAGTTGARITPQTPQIEEPKEQRPSPRLPGPTGQAPGR